MSSPLILTAAFDPTSAEVFQGLRDRHFPAALNIVPAHLTLFHHLPGDEIGRVVQDLARAVAGVGPLPFKTTGVRFLGRGCALDVGCNGLPDLQRSLAQQWSSWLTKQDSQGFRPHVTVQNKVDPEKARRLCGDLAGAPPITGHIVGLDLWFYRGGPWERAAKMRFADGS